METTSPQPAEAPRPWRKRHPVAARTLLYGAALALVAGGALVWANEREKGRQEGLLTILKGAEDVRSGAPETTLKVVREQVLAASPNADVRLRGRLAEAAALDELRRFAEAEAAYQALSVDWPAGRARGTLVVPWANMRIRAGKAPEAKAMLSVPGATEGAPPEWVADLAKRLESVPLPAASDPPGGGR
jgi:hypothetical protein